jgi:hypothetical protein
MMDAMLNEYQLRMVKGEAAGHAFEGNQYTGGGGGETKSVGEHGFAVGDRFTDNHPVWGAVQGQVTTVHQNGSVLASITQENGRTISNVAYNRGDQVTRSPALDTHGVNASDAPVDKPFAWRDSTVSRSPLDETGAPTERPLAWNASTVNPGESPGETFSRLTGEVGLTAKPVAEPEFEWHATQPNPFPGKIKKGTVVEDKPDLEYLERVSQGNGPMAVMARNELLKLRSPMLTKGEAEGHPFRGNQYAGGESGGETTSGQGRPTGGNEHAAWVAGGMKGDSPTTAGLKEQLPAARAYDRTMGSGGRAELAQAISYAQEGDRQARAGDHETAADHYGAASDMLVEANNTSDRDLWDAHDASGNQALEAQDYHMAATGAAD